MRKPLVLATATAAVLAGALAAPASAATSGGTATTFSISGGSIGISAPASANLGSVATGALTLTGSLGTVTVTDARGVLNAAWTTSITSTAFTTGTATSNETVATSSIVYTSGAGAALSGQLGAMTPAVGPLNAPLATVWAGTSNNTVSWTPSVTMTLLPSQVAGTYSGTITHSVT